MNGKIDEWGYNQSFMDKAIPILTFLYEKYWRVEMTGLENIPSEGRALLVGNHSGQFPFDGFMLGTGILTRHPAKRVVRGLYGTWFSTLPFAAKWLTQMGGTPAIEENGIRLLKQGHIVGVFPEGYKGARKLFKDRYRLARFGRGGFIRMALKTQTCTIPASIVGSEEIYISLAHIPGIENVVGYPMPPISPFWPWLGLFGLIPLPTKWYIDIGKPIATDAYPPEAANNLSLVLQLTDLVRNTVQEMVYQRLSKRKSIFFS